MSPLLTAEAVATGSSSTAGISERRAQALGLARSLDEIFDVLPVDYRVPLTPFLREIYHDAERRAEMRVQVRKYEEHKAQGTLPSILMAVRAPSFQQGRKFLAAVPGADKTDAIAQRVSATQRVLLDACIEGAQEELAWYEAKLTPEALLSQGVDLLKVHWNDHLVPISKVPTIRNVFHEDGTLTGTQLESWAISPSVKALFDRMIDILPRIIYTVLALVENKTLIEKQKAEAKKALKDRADVEMADGTADNDLKKEVEDLRKSFEALRKSKESGPSGKKDQKKHAQSGSPAAGNSTGKASSSKNRDRKKERARVAMSTGGKKPDQAKKDQKGKGRAKN
ncbi:hypothetical protein BDW22DRAFT_1427980 [Trametopsis cervina]|nr:hypothetical protein BDW22DRAFT_1427980 [Trametopsis cervina]